MAKFHLKSTPQWAKFRFTMAVLLIVGCVCVGRCREYNSFEALSENELAASIWNFSGRAEIDRESAQIEIQGNSYIECINRICDFYLLENDTLIWNGYNVSRRLGAMADKRVIVRDLSAVSDFESSYSASGKLDANVPFKENGFFRSEYVSTGKAIISIGDTLQDVSLTKITHTIIAGSDSAQSDTISTVTYRWFLPHTLEPVAFQRGDALYKTNGTEFLKQRSENQADNSNVEDIKYILGSATIELTDGQIHVALSSPLAVNIYIMDLLGNVCRSVSGDVDNFIIETSGLLSREYIISITHWRN